MEFLFTNLIGPKSMIKDIESLVTYIIIIIIVLWKISNICKSGKNTVINTITTKPITLFQNYQSSAILTPPITSTTFFA